VGWFPLAVFVFRDDLRALADRAFYGAGSRAGRAGLRVAATYAGAADALDVAALSPEQAAEAVEYLSDVERAGLASARLEGPRDSRLTLLARDEFAAVRAALGLPAQWSAGDRLPVGTLRRHVAATLEPRERQALGLRYLGYSDKEMARLMSVKPNVPRSYLSEGKRKLGLTAGAPLMLFVHSRVSWRRTPCRCWGRRRVARPADKPTARPGLRFRRLAGA
jgi:DNA-binding CsgD family transcriptional regulator